MSIIHSWDYACLRAGLIPPQVCGKLQWQADRQAGGRTGRQADGQAGIVSAATHIVATLANLPI